MSEIRNLTRNGETFYPLTTSSAVINESTGEGLVIDDVPTAGSDNLVKSGGVAEAFNNIFPNGEPESLNIVDNNENAILKLKSYISVDENGNVKTKGFDSSSLSGPFIIVDINGKGNYTSLENAIANAGDSYSENISKTIIVMPGTYIMNTPADDSNWASFGNRSLNIIGTDREKCIVKGTVGYYTHSGTEGVTEPRDYAPLKLAGNCYIANLTIISTDDDFQMPSDDSGNPEERHRSYCIHFDYNCPGAWTGHVDNCILINDHQTCIGCGIRGKIVVTNCILESTIYDQAQSSIMGCIAAHETLGDYDAELFVKDSILTGHNCPCVLLSNVYNNQIKATFINNVAFNDVGGNVLIMNSAYHTKTKYCFGNNNSELNY